jgi:hypothetical protein
MSQWVIRGLPSQRDVEAAEDGRLVSVPLYWSNDDGWVDRGSATIFTQLEAIHLNLPMGGCWERVQEGGH